MHFPWSAANENSSWKTIESRAQKVKAAAFEILFLLSPLSVCVSLIFCVIVDPRMFTSCSPVPPAIAVLAQFDDLTIL